MKSEEEIRKLKKCLEKRLEGYNIFEFMHYEERTIVKALSWVLEDESEF